MTWEQLTTDAKKAKDAGAKYGFLFGQFDRYYQLEPLPVQLGGSVGATGDGNLTPDFTSDAWVKAFTWYRSLFEDGVSPRGMKSEQTDPAFLAGQAAYMVEGPWLLPQLQASKVDWGVAPQPVFEGGKPATPTGSWSLGMNPFSKQKEAAAVFLNWMTVVTVAATSSTAPIRSWRPAWRARRSTSRRRSSPRRRARTRPASSTSRRSNTAVNRVPTIGYIEFETIMNQAFADIRNGADPKTALDKASSS